MKPLIASVSPSGHRISTPQPDPGFFRATKVGRCSDITRICACGLPIQASYPATIKLTHYQRLTGGNNYRKSDWQVRKRNRGWIAAHARRLRRYEGFINDPGIDRGRSKTNAAI